MSTIIFFMIAQQCSGDNACMKYLADCTWHITRSKWAVHKIEDVEDRAKFALSICEKQFETKWSYE